MPLGLAAMADMAMLVPGLNCALFVGDRMLTVGGL